MPPPRQGDRKKPPSSSKSKPQRSRQSAKQSGRKASNNADNPAGDANPTLIDFSAAIPISLQQLLLDVFKTALLAPPTEHKPSPTASQESNEPSNAPDESEPLDTKPLIQTIKSHLYQRDFDSAFTDAGEDLLRAYALRWSAARALGYAGLFRAVLGWMHTPRDSDTDTSHPVAGGNGTRVVCIGGGAGAEIVALAAAWRDLAMATGVETLGQRVTEVSLDERQRDTQSAEADGQVEAGSSGPPGLSVAAVDIADWSSVVERLSRTIASAEVPASFISKHQPPLVSEAEGVSVLFRRADVLTLPELDLKDVLLGTHDEASAAGSLLVTLMFTLNELFSTSMAKTTGLLLRMTDLLPSGAVLLVVDSPGSYSTLKLGKGNDGAAQERKYPMKFLLDHTLLSVAEGKWERIYSQDSRWWRRDATRLRYDVGEGAGLEDMRFQVHVYRRI
ncbi:uncharacterized protein N7459_007292 [Penicillium hispanicum]|uniref:uncharacterized protein n=1 Tax=Penicillium hispanicum TaxID=1080232 RepID=UPI00254011CC|nr:uncharacterized protein N7459_007292 [Penicillium hispanicum]KAJ5578328.1 hypothetical protein N7459_007292 [Penicillium hispanicum]